MASPTAVGRRRGLPKQMSSEDQALNQIAKEAEARLSAKRAARAEARSIRMKDLERKQKEADEEMDKAFDEEDDASSRKRGSSTRITATTAPSCNAEPPVVVADPHLKEALRATEEKYRKAMVNTAQLDNERQALQYQVECLKDMIEDLGENLENVKDELLHKSKDYNKLHRDHELVTEDFKKSAKLLEDRERILDEHGINLDGTLKEQDEADGNVDLSTSSSHQNVLSNHIGVFSEDVVAERESLLSEIHSLKEELADLKKENDTDAPRSRIGVDHMRPEQRADLERSFVNVSTEAVRDDARHTGLYVNNNEKCDEFEVIDDGSQQGGIKNFEDKSFEKSARSSLTSSVRTEVVDESDVPLEISVDSVKPEQKDEYDIVHMDDSPKSSSADKTVDFASMLHDSNSPIPNESDINVNKYLMSDEEEDSAPQHLETFNVDRYFANNDVKNVVGVPTDNDDAETEPRCEKISKDSSEEMKYETIEYSEVASDRIGISDEEISKDSPEEMKYETIEYSEVASDRIGISDEAARCSPYIDLESESSELTTVGEENSQLELSQDIVHVERIGESSIDDYDEINKEESEVTMKEGDVNKKLGSSTSEMETSVDHAGANTQQDVGADVSPTLADDDTKDVSNVMPEPSESTAETTPLSISEGYELPSRDYNTDAVDGAGMSAPATREESDLVKTLEENKLIAIQPGVFSDQQPLTVRTTSLSEHEKSEVRKNVVDLYDQVADETGSSLHSDATDGLPVDATFGVFGITGTSRTDASCEPHAEKFEVSVGADVDTSVNTSVDTSMQTESKEPEAKKPEGWLVRVESFNAPKSKAPEIKVISPEKKSEIEPVPKERKKKKKKKKEKDVEKQSADSAELAAQDVSAPSAPELLGFEGAKASPRPSPQPSPQPSPKQKKPSIQDSDIPQQFLDVSNELAGESLSDVSDAEHEEGFKKKRDGSKRGSKKEGCKTQ